MASRSLIGAGGAAIVVALVAAFVRRNGWDGETAIKAFRELRDRLGFWALPVYVSAHTVSLSLCLPYAVFFEAGASLLFGFIPGVLCVFAAKVLGASLSFWIGRAIFRSSKTAAEWALKSKYFHVLARGVQRDGWKFVLLARFSPLPSYVINYSLAATDVRFLVDFLIPTVVGCLPMILQNTSLGSLAGVAISSSSRTNKSKLFSYLFPLLGIASSIAISWRIKKYTSGFQPSSSTSGALECDSSVVALSKEAADDISNRRG